MESAEVVDPVDKPVGSMLNALGDPQPDDVENCARRGLGHDLLIAEICADVTSLLLRGGSVDRTVDVGAGSSSSWSDADHRHEHSPGHGSMSESLYVATDFHGVEHPLGGQVPWVLPAGHGLDAVTNLGRLLTLRSPEALLDVLDERIFRAEPLGEGRPATDGTVVVDSARLTETPWNTEKATRFAIDCASHVLGGVGSATFADGTTFATVIEDAQRAIDGIDGADDARLGYVARLSVLRRLRHDRDELADMSIAIAVDDGQRDLDLFDDPTHDILAPAIDAVLAAIEALRAHLVPRPLEVVEDTMEEHEAHRTEDRRDVIPMPSAWSTPIGNVEVHQEWLAYEPSWTSAREAARHARHAQRIRHDAEAEFAERSWQAERLSELLEGE